MLYSTLSSFGRMLGSLFYYAPDQQQNPQLLALLQSAQWQDEVPFLSDAEKSAIQTYISEKNVATSAEDYQRLFIGPDALPIAPWGSVYLDKEQVIFGDSLLALRAFLDQHSLHFQLTQNEPEDHFGLMLMMMAYLAEHKPEALKAFFEQHFLIWAYRFLSLFNQQPATVYVGLGKMAEKLLSYAQERLKLTPQAVELYR